MPPDPDLRCCSSPSHPFVFFRAEAVIRSDWDSGGFALFSEKRHKEALFGRKFDKRQTSSRARHYRLVGRGGGLPRISKRTNLPTRPIPLPARRCVA